MKKMKYIEPTTNRVVMPEQALMAFQPSPAIDPQSQNNGNSPARRVGPLDN